jgi:translation initiation factor 2 beta subunit (eIF-2beta)/eIF-5
MKKEEIQILLEKYWTAETNSAENIDEEFNYAKKYFSQKVENKDITSVIISNLVNKYFEGETSVDEEAIIKQYFAQDNIDASLRQYKMLFTVYNNAGKLKYNKELSLRKEAKIVDINSTKKPVFTWLRGAAAAAVLTIGSYVAFQNYNPTPSNIQLQTSIEKPTVIEPETPEEAYAMTVNALALVSKKYSKGRNELLMGMKSMNEATDLTN